MAKSKFLLKSFQLSALAMALALVGCGGGGNDTLPPKVDGSQQSGGQTNTPDLPTPPSDAGTNSVVSMDNIQVFDANNKITRVITGAGVIAKVKVKDVSGKGISSALVKFSAENVIFGTSNGSVLTNSEGEASIAIKPANLTDTGSYQLKAEVNYKGETASQSYNFSLQAADTEIVNLKLGEAELASGASTIVTLETQDKSTKVHQNDVSINFSTTCGTFDNATVVSANQGNVKTTYKAIDAKGNLCEGEQTIIASSANNPKVTKNITVKIAKIEANSVVYTTNQKIQLGIRDSGSSKSGEIEFTVFSNGVPAANQDIEISKQYAPEDFSFDKLGNKNPTIIKSDAKGKVRVTLYPGAKPGPVEMKAVLKSNIKIFALSKDVAVATGRATQNGFSLSTDKNSLSNGVEGDQARVTARLVDKVGNPVPDGTVVSFITEGGSITPNCETAKGICSVVLTTQNPRPLDNRVTVLAYVEGDKHYIDTDGDNQYTVGKDTLSNNIGDFFRDDNENGIFDIGEFIYRRVATGQTCAPSTFIQPNVKDTCDNKLEATLRRQMVFAFAESRPIFVGLAGINPEFNQVIGTGNAVFQMYGNSAKTVPMPSGTSIEVSAKDNTADNEKTCEAEIIGGSLKVPDVMNLLTPQTFNKSSNDSVKYTLRTRDCFAGDDVRVTVTTPNNLITTRLLSIR